MGDDVSRDGGDDVQVPEFCKRVALERNCSPELVRAITMDCLASLHEASFKRGIGMALSAAYWELGPLAAWHFGGLLVEAAKSGEPGELIEHYQRLDSTMRRFAHILDQWKEEEDDRRRREEETGSGSERLDD